MSAEGSSWHVEGACCSEDLLEYEEAQVAERSHGEHRAGHAEESAFRRAFVEDDDEEVEADEDGDESEDEGEAACIAGEASGDVRRAVDRSRVVASF